MKKVFIMGICLCLLLTSCGKSDNKEETTSTNAVTESTTVTELTTKAATETTTEITTEATTKNNITLKKDKLILDNGKYRYEIEKTDFEKAYPEELLLQFANMLSMNFGVEDYYDWNTTGENIFTDIFANGISVSDYSEMINFFHGEVNEEAIRKFRLDAGEKEDSYLGGATVSLKDINKYLVNTYGPSVKKLTTDDFYTVKEAIEKGLPVSGGMSEYEHRCFYSGVDDIIIIQSSDTGYTCISEYIYDVREKDGNYYVYTLGEGGETYGKIDNLNYNQQVMLESAKYNIREYMQTKVYKFGCTDDGDVYLKSVDKKYLISINAEYKYIIESDKPVEVENKKASTEEYKIIDKLPDGTKILVGSKWERIGWTEIITEDYLGFVETKYIKEIAE